MSSTDNTRDKLVASMRKTKADAAEPAATTKKAAPATKKTTARKAPAKPQAARKPAAKPAAVSDDPYQAGRRVWPD